MSSQITRFKRQGRHNFTLAEIEDMREKIPPLLSEAAGAETKIEGHKNAIKNLTNTVKHLRKEAEDMAMLVETGWTERPISCFRFKSYAMRVFIYVAEDTAEEVCREPFTLGDNQSQMDDIMWPADRTPPVPLWKAVADLKLDRLVYSEPDTLLRGAGDEQQEQEDEAREPWEDAVWEAIEFKKDKDNPFKANVSAWAAQINGVNFRIEEADGVFVLSEPNDQAAGETTTYQVNFPTLDEAKKTAWEVAQPDDDWETVQWLTPGEGYDGFEHDICYAEINGRKFCISKSNIDKYPFCVYERVKLDPLDDPKVGSASDLDGAKEVAYDAAFVAADPAIQKVIWHNSDEAPDEVNKGSYCWADIEGVRFSIFHRKSAGDYGLFIGSRKGTKPDMIHLDLNAVKAWSENWAASGSGTLWDKLFGGAE